MSDIIQATDARKYMYDKVYYHKTSMACGVLIEKTLHHAASELNLIERVQDPQQFRYINDCILGEIMALPDTSKAKYYCKKLLDRELPVLVKETKYKPGEFDKAKSPDKTISVKTKVLSGIECANFEKFGIRFIDNNGGIYTVGEALSIMNYTYQEPYHIARWFEVV